MIRVLSYNIWFDAYRQHERLNSLIMTIDKIKPDVLCFQEVIPEVYETLQEKLPEYKFRFPNRLKLSYGSVIMSRHTMTQFYDEFYPETQMGRNLLAVNIYKSEHNITIATSHFESIFNSVNTVKTSQYIYANRILDKLSDSMTPVIFCSDTNILPTEEKYFFKNSSWNDSYNVKILELSESSDIITKFKLDNEYTYDTVKNSNLATRNIREIRSRIDRVMYKGNLKLLDFKLIKGSSIIETKNEDIIDCVEPSDHFGVLAEFDIIHKIHNDITEIDI